MPCRLAGGDRDAHGQRLQTGVGGAHARGARRHRVQPELSIRVRKRLDRGTLDHQPGAFEILAIARIEHASFDCAGGIDRFGGTGRSGRQGKREPQGQRD